MLKLAGKSSCFPWNYFKMHTFKIFSLLSYFGNLLPYLCSRNIKDTLMKLSEAIVYALHVANQGLTTQDLADIINLGGLHIRKDGERVTSQQVWWCVKKNPAVFTKDGGLIRTVM